MLNPSHPRKAQAAGLALLGVLLLGVAVGVVQRSTNARLREEITALEEKNRQQADQLRRLREETRELGKYQGELAELQRLRQDEPERQRLRAQVEALGRQLQEARSSGSPKAQPPAGEVK